MGLFDYLLAVKPKNAINREETENFFYGNNFKVVEKSNNSISLVREYAFGNVEVLIDNDREFYVRTKIQNNVTVIEEIIAILEVFGEKGYATVTDVQNKQLFDLFNLQNLKELYLKRQSELKKIFLNTKSEH